MLIKTVCTFGILACGTMAAGQGLEIVDGDRVVAEINASAHIVQVAPSGDWLSVPIESTPALQAQITDGEGVSASVSEESDHPAWVSESAAEVVQLPPPEPAPTPEDQIAEALCHNQIIRFRSAHFETGRADLTDQGRDALSQVARAMEVRSGLRIMVTGHTDSRGSDSDNQRLSEARAAAVVSALVNNYGIDPDRLQSQGFGETRPIADNTTDAGMASNRRVELLRLAC